MTYDDYHNMLTQEYYDENGNEAYFDDNSYEYTKVCYEYDTNGNIIKVEYCLQGGDSEVYTKAYTYDQWGNCTSEKKYDTNGELEVSYKGYAYIGYVYNVNGKCVEETYYDENDQLVLVEDSYYGNYAKVVKEYDDSSCSYPSKISYYDAEGNPIMVEPYTVSGYSSVEYVNRSASSTYNEVSYYDVDGELVLVTDGESSYARIEYTYNDEMRLVEEQYFDIDGQLINQVDGYAKIQYEYSESAYDYTKSYYDEDGNLTLYKGSYAMIKVEYDLEHAWNKSKESYYDLNGDMCSNEIGYAVVTYKYDEYGNCIETTYYNEKEEIVDVTIAYYGTYAKVVEEYEEDSYYCIMKAYYSADGELCIQEEGYALIRYEYDDNGYCIKTSYYGENEEPVMIIDYDKTYFSVEKEYMIGSSSNVIKTTYYDVDGNLAEVPYSYSYPEITYVSLETLYYNNSSCAYKYYDINGEEVTIDN